MTLACQRTSHSASLKCVFQLRSKEVTITLFPVQSLMTNYTGQYSSYASFLDDTASAWRCNLCHQMQTLHKQHRSRKPVNIWHLVSLCYWTPSPLASAHFLCSSLPNAGTLTVLFFNVSFPSPPHFIAAGRWKNTAIFLFLWHLVILEICRNFLPTPSQRRPIKIFI